MNNYDAIMKMAPEHLAEFLDQVLLTGLNTGMYAAHLDGEQQSDLLDENPYNFEWLNQDAEEATLRFHAEDGDTHMLDGLCNAVLRSAGIKHEHSESGTDAILP